MTVHELQEFIVRHLAREYGGGTARWRRALGAIKVYSRATHAHCNWDARPSGAIQDVARIERAIDAVRLQNPFVSD